MKKENFILILFVILALALVAAGCAGRSDEIKPALDTAEVDMTAADPVTAAPETTEPVPAPDETEAADPFDPDALKAEAVFKFGFTVSGLEFEPGDEVDINSFKEFFRFVIMPDWQSSEFVKEEYRGYAAGSDTTGEYYNVPAGVMASELQKYFSVTFTNDPDEIIKVLVPIGTETKGTSFYPNDEPKTEGAANVVRCYGSDYPYQGIVPSDDGDVFAEVAARTFTLGIILRDDGTYKFEFCRDYQTHHYTQSDLDPLIPGTSTLDDLYAIAPEILPAEENGRIYVCLPGKDCPDMFAVFSSEGVFEELRYGLS